MVAFAEWNALHRRIRAWNVDAALEPLAASSIALCAGTFLQVIARAATGLGAFERKTTIHCNRRRPARGGRAVAARSSRRARAPTMLRTAALRSFGTGAGSVMFLAVVTDNPAMTLRLANSGTLADEKKRTRSAA